MGGERKAIVAMVNIDGSDGWGFWGVADGLIASRLTPTFEIHSPVGASLLAKAPVQPKPDKRPCTHTYTQICILPI